MRNSILILLTMLALGAVTYETHEPVSAAFGYPSEDFGGGSYLGVDTRDITADRLSDLKLREEHGVEVTLVDQDAPAGKAGIKEHDVILNLNGNQVESVEQLRRMIHEIPPGRPVTLGISRDGTPMTIKAQLADRKRTFSTMHPGKSFSFAVPTMPVMPAMPSIPSMPDIDVPVSVVVVHSSARSGLMVENLTPQLGEFFGAKNGQGVLVRSVEKGSRAVKAGFHAGDVIVKVNGDSINDSGDFTRAVHARKGSTLNISVIRDKKEQNLSLTLPERNQSELLNESFELPDIEADTAVDLSELESHIASIKPELQRAVSEVRRVKPMLARDLCNQCEKLNQHMRELQRELRDQKLKIQEELKHEVWPFQADI